jgi:septum formation protein
MQGEMDDNSDRDNGLILASASARRRKILSELGVRFSVLCPPDDEESGGPPDRTVRTNSLRKLLWCRKIRPSNRILAADTVVVFGGAAIGKPRDRSEAASWFRAFSGREQVVITGVAYLDRLGVVREDVVSSVVCFRDLSDGDIARYLDVVDPLDKAGGYDIDQSRELIVERWEGSRTNIMGLPVELVAVWLREDGLL